MKTDILDITIVNSFFLNATKLVSLRIVQQFLAGLFSNSDSAGSQPSSWYVFVVYRDSVKWNMFLK